MTIQYLNTMATIILLRAIYLKYSQKDVEWENVKTLGTLKGAEFENFRAKTSFI